MAESTDGGGIGRRWRRRVGSGDGGGGGINKQPNVAGLRTTVPSVTEIAAREVEETEIASL
jgi:hypothetical protein